MLSQLVDLRLDDGLFASPDGSCIACLASEASAEPDVEAERTDVQPFQAAADPR